MNFFKALALVAVMVGLAMVRPAMAADPENTLVMELPWGNVLIELRPDLAPNHVARIKELTRQGFYNGTPFHRVIDGFMAQGGDPTGTGTGGSGKNLKAEFSQERFVRGIVGMARASSPNSADSQFFIMLGSAPSLDYKYTVVGKVIEGMENVNKITKGDSRDNGRVSRPDSIVSMTVQSDQKK